MPKFITFKKVGTVKPPAMDRIMEPFERNMKHYIEDIVLKRFEWSIATWRRKPTFTTDVRRESWARVVGECYTEDDVYRFLNDGTSIRYATMTPGFVAKTKPGRIRAVGGSGGLAYVSRAKPRRGIKARKFDEQIASGTERFFENALTKSVMEAARLTGQFVS